MGRERQFQEIRRGSGEGYLVLSGYCRLSDVRIKTVDSTLSLTEEQCSHLPDAVADLESRGMVVTDGPIYRLEGWELSDGLELNVAHRSYFDSVLLKSQPQWCIRSQVLAVVAVTQCADGYLLEKRSAKVASLSGRLHPLPSGSTEPPEHPETTMIREAAEELGLQPDELSELGCLGLVFGQHSGVYQLVCRSSTSLSFEQIKDRPCEGLWERSEIHCTPNNEEDFLTYIEDRKEQLTPGGRVALLLEAAHRWGSHILEHVDR